MEAQKRFSSINSRTPYIRYITGLMNNIAKGDYKGLKEFTQPRTIKYPVDHKFQLLADMIPEQGPPIKMPTPAWQEKPLPLNEQLKIMQAGGDAF